MARNAHTVVELRAGPFAEPDLAVTRVTGHEALSEPFSFVVEVFPASGEPLEMADLLGSEALLTLRRPGGAERHVHGLLSAVELADVAAGRPRYRACLEPRLVRLRHARRSRIFQELAAPDIVRKVLDEGGVKHRLALSGGYVEREYCVQYRESDLDFVSRLLEEEGIFYFFEHDASGHVMVLSDDTGGCADIPDGAAVPFRSAAGVTEALADEHLSWLEGSQRLRSGKVVLRDFDFERPALDLSVRSEAADDAFGLEVYDYPGGYREPGSGARRGRVRLEELRFEARTFEGGGTCSRLLPGAVLEVTGHPEPAFDQRLLLLDVRHEASQQEAAGAAGALERGYRNTFAAILASAPYRPRRRTKRPCATAETAVVVGPAGEEVQPDEHGRIKVQFHWDRVGKRDDRSSCWVRLAQAWAGPTFGTSFVPRVGQEVLVRFLEGDPDRPLVMGAVYNGENPPPLPLPDEKTRSTLRTSSSPGGDGANEIRIEDAAGEEELYVHAQRDETLEVDNDKAQRVIGNEALQVAKDRTQEVRGNQALFVARDDVSQVDGSQTQAVSGNRMTTIAQSQSEEVGEHQSLAVSKNRWVTVMQAGVEMVGAAAALNVGGAYAVNVAGALNEAVGALKSVQVAGAHVERVGASRSEQVEKNYAARVGGDLRVDVKGAVTVVAGKDHKEDVGGKLEQEVKEPAQWLAKAVELQADKFSLVVGGEVALSVEKSGKVKLAGSAITVDGSNMKLKGGKVKKVAAGSAGRASPTVRKLDPGSEAKAMVRISLADQDGNPVANERFRVELPDGSVVEGKLDAAGSASIPAGKEGSCKVTFPNLDEKAWKGE